MEKYPLRALVRRVLDESEAPDPGSIAELVLDRIDEKDLRAALAVTLADYVRHVIAGSRNASFGFVGHSAEAARVEVETTAMEPEAGGERPKQTYRSYNTEMLQGYGRQLRERLHVGPTSKDYKLFGLCEIPDLMFAVTERRETAAKTSAMADWYQQVVEKMTAHKATRVQDLPHTVLTELFGVRP
jgi:hypothetical protein